MKDIMLSLSEQREVESPISARAGDVAFRLAGAGDSAQVSAFLRSQSMEGTIRLATAAGPEFFAPGSHAACRADVLMATHGPSGKIVGLGLRTLREAWIGGRRGEVAHLSLLRVAAEFRRRR